MKKHAFYLASAALGIYLIITSFGGSLRYPGGSPAGYTGSPGDGKDCTICHGGSSSTVDNWIAADIPDGGYIPGETYNITVTVSGNGDKGFLVSPQNFAGEQLGELIAGPQTELKGGTKYVTQSNASSQNPRIWNFQWIAPEAGTGQVVFYGAFTVNKPVTKLSTLNLIENTGVGIGENYSKKMKVFPVPARDVLHVQLDTPEQGAFFEILDLRGKQVYSQSIHNPDFSVRLDKMKAGIYFARYSGKRQQESFRLLLTGD